MNKKVFLAELCWWPLYVWVVWVLAIVDIIFGTPIRWHDNIMFSAVATLVFAIITGLVKKEGSK